MRRVRTVVARSEGKVEFLPIQRIWEVSGVMADTFPLNRELARGPRVARRMAHWIRLVLVEGNDALNLDTDAQMTGANGPCGGAACYTTSQASGCGSSTLTRNRIVTGLLVGASNFDIGHIAFGLNGGLHDAILLGDYLGQVCRGEAGEELLDRYVRKRRTANIDFVQTQSISNKKMLEESDPAKRRATFDELRRIAADRNSARDFLVRSSMIWSVRGPLSRALGLAASSSRMGPRK